MVLRLTSVASALLLAGHLALAGSAQTPAPAAPALPPAREKACLEFAGKIEATINAGDPSLMDGAMDKEELLTRTIRGMDLSDQAKAGIRTGWAGLNMGSAVVGQNIKNGGSYKFLRLRLVDGEPRALFRLINSSEGGVNYHDMVLVAPDKGEVRFADLFIYLAGERISDTLRRSLLPLAVHEQRGLLAKLTGQESDYIKSLPAITRMQQQNREGKPEQALKTVKALPASVQRDKNILIQRIGFANAAEDGKEFTAAVEDFQKAFPGDPALDLLLLQSLQLNKKYDEYMKAADNLDRKLGGDPYIHVLKAGVLSEQQKLDAARESAKTAIAAEPSMKAAYWTLLSILLAQKDYAETARNLTVVEDDLGVQLADDLGQVEIFAEFAKSEEGRKWQASRKQSAPPAPGQAPAPTPAPAPRGAAE